MKHFGYAALPVWLAALSFLQFFVTPSGGRAQTTSEPGLPPARPFTATTVMLPQFREKFEQSLKQRARDMGLDPASYGEVASRVAEFVQLCSGLTVEQMVSVSPSVSQNPNLIRLEGGKYKECDDQKLFDGPSNGRNVVIFSSATRNWDSRNGTWNGPKLHVFAYFQKLPGGPAAARTMDGWGTYYGILNADISDGTTPATAPPRKTIAEQMREMQEARHPKPVLPVPGQYVCPGTVLHVSTRAAVIGTPGATAPFSRLPDITVKKPVRIARTDATGQWFQDAGSADFYYQIASGQLPSFLRPIMDETGAIVRDLAIIGEAVGDVQSATPAPIKGAYRA